MSTDCIMNGKNNATIPLKTITIGRSTILALTRSDKGLDNKLLFRLPCQHQYSELLWSQELVNMSITLLHPNFVNTYRKIPVYQTQG